MSLFLRKNTLIVQELPLLSIQYKAEQSKNAPFLLKLWFFILFLMVFHVHLVSTLHSCNLFLLLQTVVPKPAFLLLISFLIKMYFQIVYLLSHISSNLTCTFTMHGNRQFYQLKIEKLMELLASRRRDLLQKVTNKRKV